MLPKIFHRVWPGDDPIPERYEEFWEKTQELHPDYEFKTWHGTEFELVNQALYDVQDNFAAAADILRLEVLYKFGGIYIDTDIEFVRRMHELETIPELFFGQDTCGVANAFMGATPRHRIIRKAIDVLQKLPIRSILTEQIPLLVGPDLIKRIAEENVGVMISNQYFVYRQRTSDKDIIAIHHSDMRWSYPENEEKWRSEGKPCLPCVQKIRDKLLAEVAYREMKGMFPLGIAEVQKLDESAAVWMRQNGYTELFGALLRAYLRRAAPSARAPALQIEKHALKRLDTRSIPAGPELRCFVVVRNELARLPFFLDYHRRLGISRFFFVDNDSIPEVREYLLSQPDVCLFHTSQPYSEAKFGVRWVEELLPQYAAGWCALLDIDEFLVYPDCEQRSLPEFLEKVRNEGADIVPAIMVDMYSDKALSEFEHSPGDNLLEKCPFYELETDADKFFASECYPLIPEVSEVGVRWRFFKQPGCRKKYPLVYYSTEIKLNIGYHYASGHFRSSARTALLHFKFLPDFQSYVRDAVGRNAHWNNSILYKQYQDALDNGLAEKSLYLDSKSVRYTGSAALCEAGWLRDPVETIALVE